MAVNKRTGVIQAAVFLGFLLFVAGYICWGLMRKGASVSVILPNFITGNSVTEHTGFQQNDTLAPIAIGVLTILNPSVTAQSNNNAPLGAIVTLYNETPRARQRFFTSLQTWEKYLTFAKVGKYPIIIYYLEGVPGQLTEEEQQKLRAVAPSLSLEFFPVTHVVPDEYKDRIPKILAKQQPKRGLGYIFCSQFLGYEMFKHERMKRGEKYLLRLDDDVTFDHPADVDVFKDMETNGYKVGWNVIMSQWDKSSAHMDERIENYVQEKRSGKVEEFYHKHVHNGTWDMRLYAGCVELYELSVFQSEEYYDFLASINMMEGIYEYSWMEQAYKSIWMMITVSSSQWHKYACELPTLHRNTRVNWFDYEGCPK